MNNRRQRPWLGWILGLIVAPAWAHAAPPALRVGLYQNPPKVFRAEDGAPAGLFVDLLDAIAGKEGWEIEYFSGTWAEGLDRLAAGEIDLMPDVALTREREERFMFHSEPVMSSWLQIFARRGSGIRSLIDLDGQRVAVLDQSIQQSAFERLTTGFDLSFSLTSFPDYDAAFSALASGTIDAVVAHRFYTPAQLTGSPVEDTGILFHPTRLFFAGRPSLPDFFLERIDHHLAEMKQDRASAYYQSFHRWTGEEIHLRLPSWLKGVGIAAAAAMLAILAWSLTLRHQVALRTRELRARNEEIAGLYNIVQRRAEDLEKRVADRTEELILANGALLEAKEMAESADRLKSAFLATMSHELRTPLNSIIGFTGILLQKLPGPLNDEQLKQLAIVRDSARHLLALINDVLDISKIEAGQLRVAQTPLHLPVSIGKVLDIVRPLAEKKGLALHSEIAPEVGAWIGDSRRIEQILLNLLNNAVKFTERGEVALRSGIQGDRLRIAVADTGIGIADENQERVFLPFRQVDTGLARRHEGTGLGLAICRRLAELMGGTIELISQPGQGSVFTLVLPLSKARAT